MFGIIVPLGASLLGHLVFGEVFGSNGILGALYIVTGLLTVNRPAKKIFPKRVETCESETSARPTVGVQDDRYQMPEPVVRD